MDFWTLFEITVVPHLRIGFRSVSRVLCSAAEGFLNLLGLFCNKPGFKRTWNAKRALKFSNRGYVLDQGRNAYQGEGEELLNDPRVVDLYLGKL